MAFTWLGSVGFAISESIVLKYESELEYSLRQVKDGTDEADRVSCSRLQIHTGFEPH